MEFFPRQKKVNPEEVKQAAEKSLLEAKLSGGIKTDEEAGAEEGDITDYMNPIKGIGKQATKLGMAALKGSGKEATKDLLSLLKMPFKAGKKDSKTRKPYPGEDLKTEDLHGVKVQMPAAKPSAPVPEKGTLDYSKINKVEQKAEAPTKLVYDKFGNIKEVPNK